LGFTVSATAFTLAISRATISSTLAVEFGIVEILGNFPERFAEASAPMKFTLIHECHISLPSSRRCN
jgi:hypothetical protein